MSSANGFHASRHHTPHIPDFSSSPALSPVHTSPKPGLVPSYDDHWTYEQIVLKRVPGISLGFSIAGGVDNPMFGNNTHVFVTKLTQDGLAELDGRLRANDILYKVNDTVLEDVEHAEAVQALREAGKIVNLVNYQPLNNLRNPTDHVFWIFEDCETFTADPSERNQLGKHTKRIGVFNIGRDVYRTRQK